jgi:putative transposase
MPPRVVVTDKLKSYGVARRALLPDIEHRESRYLSNRTENSHRPTRRRERQMQKFKSVQQAQRFLSAHSFIYEHFHPQRHLTTAKKYRAMRTTAFKVWNQEMRVQQAP